jgi:anti-anti-sigma regulatory factor/anti-sigma regulatory factor (Ser/Thr protein kinase)
MSNNLTCSIDRRSSYTLVRMVGDLDAASSALAHRVLMKVIADQPDAILVDLSDVTCTVPAALSVFLVAKREAARWPTIPLLLCAPSSSVAGHLSGAAGRPGTTTVFASVVLAARAIGTGVPTPMVLEDMLPVVGAARRARNLVTEACRQWGLPALVPDASVVVSELVSNAVVHAKTVFTVRVSLRARYLHLAVRDGSTTSPQIPTGAEHRLGGRGLIVVAALATAWGHLQTDDGKVIWATLRRVDDA